MTANPRAFVIGHPISHSRSPLIHGFWLEQLGLAGSYEKIAVAPDDLASFIQGMREAGFVGGNVTVPHKEAISRLAQGLDEPARAVGAANTLWFEGERLMAGNTDVEGFLASLDHGAPGWDRQPGRAVVLGAGGAARAVVHALAGRDFEICIVNRSLFKAVDLAAAYDEDVWAYAWEELPGLLGTADLLVNTTSLGMTGQPPLGIDLARLKAGALVSDIVYVPLETDLLRQARKRGHRTIDGLGMLLHQAAPGFARWFGTRPEVTSELREFIAADISK